MESREGHYESESKEEEVDLSPEIPLISGADSINKLSDEVLLKIFSYVSSNDIIDSISLVSERFHRLSEDSILLKEIYFTNGKRCDKSYIKALRFSKNLLSLKIDHYPIHDILCIEGKRCDENYIEALKSSKNLLSLKLNDCQEIHDILCIAFQNNKKLCHLEINDCFVSEYDSGMIDEIFRYSLNLTKLEIIDAKQSNFEIVHKFHLQDFLCNAMKHCKKLKQLYLTDVEIFTSSMDTIIKNGNNLEILSISNPSINASDQIDEFEEVQQFTNLKILSLEGLWRNTYFSKLAKVCVNLEDLTLLKLHFAEDTPIESMIKNSRHSLKVLKIRECEFNDCENSLHDLGNCKNIEKLIISDMKGTLTGQYNLQFISAISNMKNLTELEIWVAPEDIKKLFNSGCMKNLIKITLYSSGRGSSKITNEDKYNKSPMPSISKFRSVSNK